MKATLRDDLQVHQVAIFAEVGLLAERPELQRLCQRAASSSEPLLTQAVCQQALPGLSKAGAANLVQACAGLDLCDQEGLLTKAGREAAESGLVAIPEQGLYRLWLAQHPLLGRRVLHLERIPVDGKDQNYSMDPLPLPIAVGAVFASVIDGARFKLLREPKGCRAERQLQCALRWELGFLDRRSRFTLSGKFEEGMKIEERFEGVQVDHATLLHTWTRGAWDEAAQLLRVSLQDLPEAAQESFHVDRDVGEVDVPGKGRYRGVTLKDAPLGPADADAAQRWAQLRFDRRRAAQRGYLSRSALEGLFAGAVKDTPLVAFGVTLPSPDRLLAAREQARDRWGYWQIAAAEDLCP